ncbi:MAG: hypothetical protein ACTSU2_17555 [Promethearchaeota archaeon]
MSNLKDLVEMNILDYTEAVDGLLELVRAYKHVVDELDTRDLLYVILRRSKETGVNPVYIIRDIINQKIRRDLFWGNLVETAGPLRRGYLSKLKEVISDD